ncbi:MAG TPA: hypothetical protein DCZ91_02960, partial [Lachnospiraceae bacterium]|nr:hypothetical protein [Lachnospiraceae bacterium]
ARLVVEPAAVTSSVYLNSVVKTPYYEAGKKYSPGLYTLDQLSKYVRNVYIIDSKYIKSGKLNTEDYRYVVWNVKITGSATQPWELSVLDTLGVEGKEVKGKVVGYKDNSDPTTNYKYAVN